MRSGALSGSERLPRTVVDHPRPQYLRSRPGSWITIPTEGEPVDRQRVPGPVDAIGRGKCARSDSVELGQHQVKEPTEQAVPDGTPRYIANSA